MKLRFATVSIALLTLVFACQRALPKSSENGSSPQSSADAKNKDEIPAPAIGPTGKTGATGRTTTTPTNASLTTIASVRESTALKSGAKIAINEAVLVAIAGNGKVAYMADAAGGEYSGIEVQFCDSKGTCIDNRPTKMGGKYKLEGTFLINTDNTHATIASPTLTARGTTAEVAGIEVDPTLLGGTVSNAQLRGARVAIKKGAEIVVSDAFPEALKNDSNADIKKDGGSCKSTDAGCSCTGGPGYSGVEVSVNGAKFLVRFDFYASAANSYEGTILSSWPCAKPWKDNAIKTGGKFTTLAGVFDINYKRAAIAPASKSDAVIAGKGGATTDPSSGGTTLAPYLGTINGLRSLARTADVQLTIPSAVLIGISGNGKSAYFADPSGGVFSGIEVALDKLPAGIAPTALGGLYKIDGTLHVPKNLKTTKLRIQDAALTAAAGTFADVAPLALDGIGFATPPKPENLGVRVQATVAPGQQIVVSDAYPAVLRNDSNTTEATCLSADKKDCCKGGPLYRGFEVSVGDTKILVSTNYYNSAKNGDAGFPLTSWPCDGEFTKAIKTGDTLIQLIGVLDLESGNLMIEPLQKSDATVGTTSTDPVPPKPPSTGGYCTACVSDSQCTGGLSCVPYAPPALGSYCAIPCVTDVNCPAHSACWAVDDTGFCGPNIGVACSAN